MSTYLEDIAEFHGKFELLPPTLSTFLSEVYEFRQKFLLEELYELQTSWHNNHLPEYLDALVDLDYVGLGTLFLITGTDANLLNKEEMELQHRPRLPTSINFIANVNNLGGILYRTFESIRMYPHEMRFPQAYLRELHKGIIQHSREQGLNFLEAWNRVHYCNMQKVRALRAEDSTRGSIYDVVKPPGWVKPDLTDLCQ